MKSAFALLTAVFFATAFTAAQQPSATTPATTPALGSLTSASSEMEHTVSRCPIVLSARQGGGLHVLRTQDGQFSPQTALTPSLTLDNPQGKRILSASVTAHGFGINNHPTPLETRNPSAGAQPRPRLTQTLTVKFLPDDNNTVSGDLRLPGFVVLDFIELNTVTFADGSTLAFASDSGCRVQPSPLMLVSGN